MTQLPHGVIPEWTVGDRLRKARQQMGLNTREFADLVGVSQKTITDAEGDRRQPRKILLNAWAMATGVPVEWLTTGQAGGGGHNPPGGDVEQPRRDRLAELTEAKRRRARGVPPTIGVWADAA